MVLRIFSVTLPRIMLLSIVKIGTIAIYLRHAIVEQKQRHTPNPYENIRGELKFSA